jgi:uncharacterized membrane protein HdeD (DUF308 family)
MSGNTDPLLPPALGSKSALLAENWWALAIRGVLAILFGLIALFLPGAALGGLVLLFAAYMFADGVFAIVSGVRAAERQQRWWPLVLDGVVDIAAGAIALFLPGLTVLAFVILLAVWAVISGVLELAAGFNLDKSHGRWWLIAGGIVSIVWGILLFIAPYIGALVLTLWLGAYALLFGISLLVLAYRLRERRGTLPPGSAQHA